MSYTPLMVHTKRISETPTLLPTTIFASGTSLPASLTEKSFDSPMSKLPPRRPSLPRALILPPGSFLARRLPLTVACISLITLACILIRARSPSTVPFEQSPSTRLVPQWSSLKDVALNSRGKPIVDFETRELPEEWRCNPFKEPGRLIVDLKTAANNVWKPYDNECPPSTLMKGLYNPTVKESAKERKPSTGTSHDASIPLTGPPVVDVSRPFYPWLVNATILLIGDSMERLHVTDFCNFVGGNLTNIDPHHPASPEVYRLPMANHLGLDGIETFDSKQLRRDRWSLEDTWDDRPESWFFTRPWVCDVEEYGATIINVFTWGMQDMEEVFQTEPFFHGPSTWMQRFHHIAVPLLRNLAIHMDRPRILHPTLIELASGFWDLRGFTEQDFITYNVSKPYPLESNIPFKDLGEERSRKWEKETKDVVQMIAKAFPGEEGVRSGPVISWRTLHHPKRNNYTPFSRAAALDQLATKLLHDLRVSSLLTRPSPYDYATRSVNAFKNRIFPSSAPRVIVTPREDFGFDERLRVSAFGPLLLGQELNFKDFLHPDLLPGSYLWCDMILYELKRAVSRVGRT